MIKYALYEAEFNSQQNGEIEVITGTTVARKYGLRRGSNKVVIVKFGHPETIPENTADVAYIHLYPQIDERNYAKIKENIINT